ncbi:carbonic anhydrase [Paludibaculum fermentans]|uniref:carbonic anhydrase n=1 Tax=Paludibaculum fermentans TaxID=1473598 RepID=UPI003EBBDF16
MNRLVLFTLCSSLLPLKAAEEHPAGVPAAKALAMLVDGNDRYAAHRETHPDASLERRAELTKGQHPYAVVLGCADSRVPPELIFDAGLGDLFVIREAGNVVDDVVLGSVEYAVEHLGVKLVMVLGHEKCGAVTAAVNHTREAHISSIVKAIEPSVQATKKEPGDAVRNCVLANAKRVAGQIRNAPPILAHAVHEGTLKVVAADYDLATGRVTILE